MSLASVLHDLVCPEARLTPTQAREFHLTESDPVATLKKVIVVVEREAEVSCVSLDFKLQNPQGNKKRPSCLSEILNPDSPFPLRAACDALLCIQKRDFCHLIHIELKSGDDNRAIRQLGNSKCFSRFLRELANHWHGIDTRNCKEWFVLLTGGKKAFARKRKTSVSIDSRPAIERPKSDPANPAVFCVYDGQKLYANQFYNP